MDEWEKPSEKWAENFSIEIDRPSIGSLFFSAGGNARVVAFHPGKDGSLPTIEIGPLSNEDAARGFLNVLTDLAARHGIDVKVIPP